MRLVAQILLSNTQRVYNKKEGMMTAEEILRSAAMTRLLLTACATSGSMGEGQNSQSCTVADSRDESAVICYRCLVPNRTALWSRARRVLVSFSFLLCQAGFLYSTVSSHEAPMISMCRLAVLTYVT